MLITGVHIDKLSKTNAESDRESGGGGKKKKPHKRHTVNRAPGLGGINAIVLLKAAPKTKLKSTNHHHKPRLRVIGK